MKIFMDLEFTGLHQQTKPISIGLVDENNKKFYAEFNDYKNGILDRDRKWIMSNIIPNLLYGKIHNDYELCEWYHYGDTNFIKEKIKKWLSEYDNIEIWSDCYAYDWVLFCQLFGHAFNIPNNICYIPFDISTLFKIKNIDPDISREVFAGIKSDGKHNSLHDAMVIKACYEKLIKI